MVLVYEGNSSREWEMWTVKRAKIENYVIWSSPQKFQMPYNNKRVNVYLLDGMVANTHTLRFKYIVM